MKKKVLCLAMATVMSVGMSTSAFAAKLGSGDVDHSGVLEASDAASILQYTLDNTWTSEAFDLGEANYDGDAKLDNTDLITANDASVVLQQVLHATDDTFLDVDAGTVSFSLNVKNSDKVTDVIDQIFTLPATSDNLSKINAAIDKVKFSDANGNSATIREDEGWAKLENAVAPLLDTDESKAAFDSLKIGNKVYESVDQLKADYEVAKKVVPSGSLTQEKFDATLEGVANVTGGKDMATVTTYGVNNGATVEVTYSLDDAAKIAFDNDFADYDNLTIGDVQNAFGNDFVINATNPQTGASRSVSIKVVRR
jgi:hypothetical protein